MPAPRAHAAGRDAKPLEGAIYAETIPFGETRDYVKKVMANSVFYSAVLTKSATPIKARLGTVPARAAGEPIEEDDSEGRGQHAVKLDNVLVLGGSGFVGRHLVAALAANGIRVTVPSRHRERAKHLLPLPTVDVVETDIMAPGALEALAGGRQAVINLVGILHGDFERVHAELPRRVVAACRARGVGRLLHMSALGASPGAPSEYLRTKAAGEQAALAATDLAVTAFRPSVIFGPEDAFLNTFAALARDVPGPADRVPAGALPAGLRRRRRAGHVPRAR
jgi:putative NADH-flavin reductase